MSTPVVESIEKLSLSNVTISQLATMVLMLLPTPTATDNASEETLKSNQEIRKEDVEVVKDLFHNTSWKSVILAIGRFEDKSRHAFTNQVIEELYSYAILWTMHDLDDDDYAFMYEAYLELYKFGLDAKMEKLEAAEKETQRKHNIAVSNAWSSTPHLFRIALDSLKDKDLAEERSWELNPWNVSVIINPADENDRDCLWLKDWCNNPIHNTAIENDLRFEVECCGNMTKTPFPEHVLKWLTTEVTSLVSGEELSRKLWNMVSNEHVGEQPVRFRYSHVQLLWTIQDKSQVPTSDSSQPRSLYVLLAMNLIPVPEKAAEDTTANQSSWVRFDPQHSHISVIFSSTPNISPPSTT
jgi:hypothetical protein